MDEDTTPEPHDDSEETNTGFVSSLKVSLDPVSRTWNLPERSAFCQKLGPTPSLKELEKHAEKFGTEMVVETAVELGYGFDACVRLQDSVDRIYQSQMRRDHPRRTLSKQKSAEIRVRTLMGIEEEKEAA